MLNSIYQRLAAPEGAAAQKLYALTDDNRIQYCNQGGELINIRETLQQRQLENVISTSVMSHQPILQQFLEQLLQYGIYVAKEFNYPKFDHSKYLYSTYRNNQMEANRATDFGSGQGF